MPRKILASASKHFLLLAIGFFVALPFLWMITTSLKPPKMAFASPYLLPTHFHWQNYLNAWTDAPFARYYLNSIFVAILLAVTAAVALATAAPLIEAPATLASVGFNTPACNVVFQLFSPPNLADQ